jgi:hypothetical protein
MKALVHLCGALALALGGLAAPALARSNVTLNGTIKYVDNTLTFNGLSATTVNRPVRFNDIEIVNFTSGAIVTPVGGNRFTDGAGAYSVTVSAAAGTMLRVRVLASTNRAATAGFLPARIDVTPVPLVGQPAPVAYNAQSPQFTVTGAAQQAVPALVLPQTTFTSGALSVTASISNLLDVATLGFERLVAPGFGFNAGAPTNGFPSVINYRWPFFPAPGTSGSVSISNPVSSFINFDDSLDDAVILHETGHLVDFLYSNYTSPGGVHFFGDSDQNPDLSFAEGFASYFGSTAMMLSNGPAGGGSVLYSDPGIYVDTQSTTTPGVSVIGLRARLENRFPFNSTTSGPQRAWGDADELAVAAMLWDVTDNAATPGNGGADDDPIDGFAGSGGTPFPTGTNGAIQIMQLMSGTLARPFVKRNLSNLWGAWLIGPNVFPSALATTFAQSGVTYTVDPPPGEPNSTPQTATPLVASNTFGPTKTFYPGVPILVPPGFLDYDQDWYSINLTAGTTFIVDTRYPNGAIDAETMADPVLSVGYDVGVGYPAWLINAANGTIANSRNETSGVLTAPVSGTHYVLVLPNTTGLARPYGNYQLRLRTLFVNSPPAIQTATSSSPLVSSAAGSAIQLTASATDANGDPITYEWYQGASTTWFATGNSVTWSPPLNAPTQSVVFTVIARDSRNAPSMPSLVPVQVLAPGALVNIGSLSIGGTAKWRVSVGANVQCTLAISLNSIPPTPVAGFNGVLEIDPTAPFIYPPAAGNAAGIVAIDLAIPANPSLIGYTNYLQALYDLYPSPYGPYVSTFSVMLPQTVVP